MEAAARADDGPVVVWRPQPGPQTALLACPVFEVFYGGARGGGKTDGMLGDFASHAGQHGPDAIGLMVRRSRTELMETIERSREIYGRIGATFHEQEKLWRFPDGARLRFAYLERDADAMNYQGHSYTRVYVEEIGNFPDPKPIMKLMATLRSGKGVPVGFRATGNPGGPGHQWVKARYIDPAPKGWEVIATEFEDPFTGRIVKRERVYIPSRLSDNRFLGSEYVANLSMSGSAELVRAWLEGDWSVVTGAYFSEFSLDRHVIDPIKLPDHWTRFIAMDWGSARPFSVGWYAVSDGTVLSSVSETRSGDGTSGRIARREVVFPKGALVKYREWYGASEPNVGLKLTAEEVAAGIRQRTAENIAYRVIDPAAFQEDGGPSIAERMGRQPNRIIFRPADNKRLVGWDQLRARLKGEDGRPMLYLFSTCRDTIRTLPALQHDENRPEDLDTDGEDHAADETRYACMSRPYTRLAPDNPEGRTISVGTQSSVTMNDLWKHAHRPREEARI